MVPLTLRPPHCICSFGWHPHYGAMALTLADLSSSVQVVGTGSDEHVWLHSLLLLLAWVVLAPLAVLIARHR